MFHFDARSFLFFFYRCPTLFESSFPSQIQIKSVGFFIFQFVFTLSISLQVCAQATDTHSISMYGMWQMTDLVARKIRGNIYFLLFVFVPWCLQLVCSYRKIRKKFTAANHHEFRNGTCHTLSALFIFHRPLTAPKKKSNRPTTNDRNGKRIYLVSATDHLWAMKV